MKEGWMNAAIPQNDPFIGYKALIIYKHVNEN